MSVEDLGRRAALGGAPCRPWIHCLLILQLWLAPNGGYQDSTCQNSDGKTVVKSVESFQVYDNGPINSP